MRNIKIKKYILIIVFIILSILLINKTYAVESIIGETCKVYQEWQELPEDVKENTIEPLPYNIGIKDEQGLTMLRSIAKSNLLPSKYDLREHIQIERKNQMQTNLCWACTANSCIETNLALRGEKYNFSERHYDYDTAYYEGKENSLNRKPGAGGNKLTAFNYLSRGSGPILEEDMPFENNEKQIDLSEIPQNVAVKKVDDMIAFPCIQKKKDNNGKIIYMDGNNKVYTAEQVKRIRDQVKEHIIKNGAVFACIKAPSNMNIYKINSQSVTADHAITIIGWDDNYNKNNFNKPATQDGAYIILNSWGEAWGENGIGYVSYEDFQIETQMTGIIKASDIEYDDIYQYDLSEMWGLFNTKYVLNVFTAKDNEKLTEVMIGSWDNQKCNVYLEIDNANKTKIASDVSLIPGYNTIKLNKEYKLPEGKKFKIIVEQTGDVAPCIGAEMNMTFYGSFTNVVVNEGETYASFDGENWIDAASEKMNAAIKAFTKKEDKYLKFSKINGIAYENVGGDLSFSISTNYSEKGKNADIKIFKEETDVTNNFDISGNVVRGNGAFIKLKCPSNIAKGKYYIKLTLPGFDTVSRAFSVLGQGEEPEDEIILESIKVTTMPNKTTYTEGEVFDKEGMVVKAFYSDGSSKVITNYVVSPSIALTTSDNKITIYYTEYPINTNTSIDIIVNKNIPDEEELEVKINSVIISADEQNVIAMGIQPNTNIKTLIETKIETNGIVKVYDKNNNELTGNEIVVTTDDEITLIFTKGELQKKIFLQTIVNGDVNGDGKADFNDMLAINKHRLNKKLLEGAYLKAGDIDKNENVDFSDMLKINKFRLGKIENL